MSDWKNPEHYKKKDFEAIDIIKSVLTEEQFAGYLLGNSLKYLLRVNDKDTPLMNIGRRSGTRPVQKQNFRRNDGTHVLQQDCD